MIHPIATRLFHFVNALAMIVMIGSGWQIYNAYPILPFIFPSWMTLGGWLGGGILWHLAAMWVLMANFMLWIVHGLLTGRFRRKLLPLSPRGLIADLSDALSGKLVHADIAHYNHVQKLLYLGVLALIVLAALSGFAIWKPVQFGWLTGLMGGFQGARLVHFLAMCGIVAFLVVHIAMALIVPKTIRAMIKGA